MDIDFFCFDLILYCMREVNQKKEKVKYSEPNPSDKAFVYQQALELTQPVAVFMGCKDHKCKVTFILDPLHEKVKVFGEGKDFIEAGLKAREEAENKISLMPHYNYDEKSALVDIFKNNNLIH